MSNSDFNIKKATTNIITTLEGWKENASLNFGNYIRQIYSSTIQDKFSSLLTPCARGVFLKVTNIDYDNDTNYIEIYQKMWISNSSFEGYLFSMINTSLMPFEVMNVNKHLSNSIRLTLTNNNQHFTLANQEIRLWIHSDFADMKEILYLYNNITSVAKIIYFNENGEEFSTKVKLKHDNLHYAKTNVFIKNNIFDPRVNFTLLIDISSIKDITFQKIYVDLNIQDENIQIKTLELSQYFKTNIIPMINQNVAEIIPFTMDGNDDIYWIKLDSTISYNIYELRGLFSNNKLIDSSAYKIIYQNRQLGVEFNEINQYLDNEITGTVYVEYDLDASLYDRASRLKWYGYNTNQYSTITLNILNKKVAKLEHTKLKALAALLDSALIKYWDIESWKSFILFFDIFSYSGISHLLIAVDHHLDTIVLSFSANDLFQQQWIKHYVGQIDHFITYNMPHLVLKIKVEF